MKKLGIAIVAAGLMAASSAFGAQMSMFTSKNVEAVNTAPASGSPFAQALKGEYAALAQEALAESDHLHADMYARKGLEAAAGNEIAPENPNDFWWWLPRRTRPEIYDAHGQLVAALPEGKTRNPAAAARAQAMYDCWVEEEHEDIWARAPGVDMYQPADIARCKDGFWAAMEEMKGMAPAEEFIVFFAFDRANLDNAAMAVIDRVADAASKAPKSRVSIVAHTDRAGSAQYNLGLSKRRADSVTNALTGKGIEANRIAASWVGETRPRVPTGDGVANPQNRRAEISIQ